MADKGMGKQGGTLLLFLPWVSVQAHPGMLKALTQIRLPGFKLSRYWMVAGIKASWEGLSEFLLTTSVYTVMA